MARREFLNVTPVVMDEDEGKGQWSCVEAKGGWVWDEI